MTGQVFTDADKARLRAEGEGALARLGRDIGPILQALLARDTLTALRLAGRDVAAVLSFADALMVLRWLQPDHEAWRTIDPNDPSTWDLGAPPIMVPAGPDGLPGPIPGMVGRDWTGTEE